MARPWDARTYDVLSTPQQAWASDVLARLHRIPRDATVLDVGCGTGRVSESLLALVPRGSVLAIDASEDVMTLARSRLGDRAQMWCQDVLDLAEAVDVIISTAALHWVSDYDRMWGRLALACARAGSAKSAVWRPGQHRSCPRAHRQGRPGRFPRAGGLVSLGVREPAGGRAALRTAGFSSVRCWLEDRPTYPEDIGPFVRTSILEAHLAACPEKGGMRSSPPSWAACARRWTTCG